MCPWSLAGPEGCGEEDSPASCQAAGSGPEPHHSAGQPGETGDPASPGHKYDLPGDNVTLGPPPQDLLSNCKMPDEVGFPYSKSTVAVSEGNCCSFMYILHL